ncbi:Gldg family protein [Ruminococcus sp.]|uniref:Gldg family protein n=1 Tax=Ruminococcus sp. TaxID=41978 RepID=UPI0025D03649|nr:Gldg family protein [Ruminococcus sp.]
MSKKDLDEKKIDEAVEAAGEIEEAAEGKISKWNSRRIKYGSMFYIIIILVIAIVVVINVMANMLAKKSPLKIDISPDNRYDISEESINVLKALNKDVDITVTSTRDYFDSLSAYRENYYAQNYGVPSDIPYEMIPEILDKYSIYAQQGSGSINVKYVNMDVDPDIINKYKEIYNGDIGSGSIIVSSGDRVRVISPTEVTDMLAYDENALRNQELIFNFAGESMITAAIKGVTDDNLVRVAFANTMNGASLYDAQFYQNAAVTFEKELLTKNGYDCTDIDIATDELSPEDYDLVVVFAPSVDFTEDIIQKLNDFLYNGGKYGKNMIYTPDLSKSGFSNIDGLLADWSIKVENNYIFDEENAILRNDLIKVEINDTDSVGELPNDKLPIIAEDTRELSQINKKNDDIVKEVLKSFDTSYTVEITGKNKELGSQESRPVVMLSRKERSEEFKLVASELLVIGSPLMTSSTYIQQNSTFNNANVLINVINNMTGKENSVVIPDKSLQSSFIAPSTKQARNIRIVVMWIIPFIIAAVGVFVLLRRRNK